MMTALKALIDIARDSTNADFAQRVSDVQMRVLEVPQKLVELQEENIRLTDENTRLKTVEGVAFHDGSCWQKCDDSTEDGRSAQAVVLTENCIARQSTAWSVVRFILAAPDTRRPIPIGFPRGW
jgi:hypothetical protein